MMKRPIRKAAVTEEKEGVVIDPERDCNRKRHSPCTQGRYKGPRMGPHLHRAGPDYDEVGVRSFTADWSGAIISGA